MGISQFLIVTATICYKELTLIMFIIKYHNNNNNNNTLPFYACVAVDIGALIIAHNSVRQ